MKNKIQFFNSVMSIHDTVNKKYNEQVADYIFCNAYDFDVYYEIYKILYEKYSMKPKKFKFTDENMSKIKKYALSSSDSDKVIEAYKILNKKYTTIKTQYSTANITYNTNKTNDVIYIEINDISLHINTDIKSRLERIKNNVSK